MARESRFRTLLPVAQCAIAALFGGIGLWQRSAILSRQWFGGTTMWDTTARFHVWPWPYKFAVIQNLPAFIAGLLLSWPISAVRPDLPETVQLAPSLFFVFVLWYWIGLKLDRQWTVDPRVRWVSLVVFTAVCLMGAFVPIGSTGYLLYGSLVWLIAPFGFRRLMKCLPRS